MVLLVTLTGITLVFPSSPTLRVVSSSRPGLSARSGAVGRFM